MSLHRVVDLLDVHADLARLATAARSAAFQGDEAAFDVVFAALRGVLLAHMDHEERWLFPAYRRAIVDGGVAPVTGSPAALERDHALLRRHLARLGSGAPPSVDAAIERHDALADLAHALEHHDVREAGSLKPLLDAWLPGDERTALLAAVSAEMSRWPATWDPGPPAPCAEAASSRGDRLLGARRALAAGEPLPTIDLTALDPRFARKAERLARTAVHAVDASVRWDAIRRLAAVLVAAEGRR